MNSRVTCYMTSAHVYTLLCTTNVNMCYTQNHVTAIIFQHVYTGEFATEEHMYPYTITR